MQRYYANLEMRARFVVDPGDRAHHDGEECPVVVDTGADSDPKASFPLTREEAARLEKDLSQSLTHAQIADPEQSGADEYEHLWAHATGDGAVRLIPRGVSFADPGGLRDNLDLARSEARTLRTDLDRALHRATHELGDSVGAEIDAAIGALTEARKRLRRAREEAKVAAGTSEAPDIRDAEEARRRADALLDDLHDFVDEYLPDRGQS